MLTIKVHFRRLAVWILLITIWTGLQSSAHADSSTANLTVSVTDTSGAIIQGAHLVLRNAETNQEQATDSGSAGAATFSFLKPGHYTLTVSKQAFADIVVDGILLNVGDEKRLQLTLKVGATAQTVNVDGSGLTINTTDASVSTVVDRKFVANMPLNGRSFQDLISMTPGVVTQSPQSSSSLGYNGDFSVNGQRTQSNYYMIDGVSANTGSGNGGGFAQPSNAGALASSTALGTTQSLLSVDALQEFRVTSSTYSAEYGRSPGGQFSFATRSGTDDIHGAAFDYLRNDFFDANDWFNDHYGKSTAALRQNDFGGTVGGPIWLPLIYPYRDRTFFFVSYEGLRLTQPQAASILYVPDTCMRTTAPVALQPILNAFPIQNGLDYGKCSASGASPSLAQFIASYSLPASIDSTSVRVDHVFSPKLSGFARAAYTPSSTQSRVLSSVQNTDMNAQTYTVGLTSQPAASISNEFRLGLSLGRSSQTVGLDGFGGAVPVNLAEQTGLESFNSPYPSITLNFFGIGSSVLRSLASSTRARQWNLVDSVGLSFGHHYVKAGIDYRRITSTLKPFSASLSGLFYSPQAVLNNATTISVVQKYVGSTPIFNETAVFLQDEWHISQKLTASLGLRWEVDPPPDDANGNDAYTVFGNVGSPSTLTLAPRGTPLWKTSWYNFAPRLGLAWIARGKSGHETVIRAGGGVFFDTDDEVATAGYTALGFRAFNVYPGAPFPITPAQLDFSASPSVPYSTVYAFPTRLQLPYTLQWNTSIDQSLGKRQVLTISYVASNGRRLLQTQQVIPGELNPSFTAVEYVAGGVTSNYQSLQTRFQRTVSQGLQALVSYTWSHSLDFGSNASALPLTRGNSDFDVRHNVQAGLTWNIPEKSANRYVNAAFSHWGLDARAMARSGFPITLQGLLLTDASGNQYFGNVTYDSSRPIYLYGSQYPGGKALNGGANNTVNPAFSQPTGTSVGNAPRNFVRGFGASQINLAIRRAFPLHEKLSLLFRAEAFNITNHPNFGYVDPYLADATFGQATSMLNQSLGTVASQYQQGGARSMQFALKVQF